MRGRLSPALRRALFFNFNPRPLAGATKILFNRLRVFFISIHAPIRGRLCSGARSTAAPGFQSTPPYGGDRRLFVCPADFVISIHAPIRGRTHESLHGILGFDFNPRPHTGATPTPAEKIEDELISIHAPIRGRQPVLEFLGPDTEFQSTPPYGGDPEDSMVTFFSWNFNPRPHTGATISPVTFKRIISDFNPRPHTGATAYCPIFTP